MLHNFDLDAVPPPGFLDDGDDDEEGDEDVEMEDGDEFDIEDDDDDDEEESEQEEFTEDEEDIAIRAAKSAGFAKKKSQGDQDIDMDDQDEDEDSDADFPDREGNLSTLKPNPSDPSAQDDLSLLNDGYTLPAIDTGEEENDEELATGKVSLREVESRMRWLVSILTPKDEAGGLGVAAGFKGVKGKSRSDHLTQLKHDIASYFGYNVFLVEKLMELFTVGEVSAAPSRGFIRGRDTNFPIAVLIVRSFP